MVDHRVHFGVTFLALGAVFVALAIPLVARKVRPNGAYGIRIPAAFASEEAWYRINRHGGFCLLGYAAALLLLGAYDLLFLAATPTGALFTAHLYAPGILSLPFLAAVLLYPRR